MTGLILVLLAFGLIIVETHVPSFGIFGIMAIISLFAGGNILVEQGELFGIPMNWEIFLGIAAAMVVILLVLIKVAAQAFKKTDTAGIEGMIDQDAVIEDWDNKQGRVTVQGELWQAVSERSHDFQKGDKVTIGSVHDLKLKIHIKD
ncbi:MAG: hypothetical protein KDJ26_05065 [Alphaproteobacteria bacterium]|nr:hypothetical protein [Alphaproteobacteria bacterium]MCB9984925.1 hypothetical protein [Micavibrio sp.]HPQ50473.1 NfeD family protein [Alphaproteobacteria bacterium]HRK97316.1 NfeD family protein [Alphaproteobacteria bacterium]